MSNDMIQTGFTFVAASGYDWESWITVTPEEFSDKEKMIQLARESWDGDGAVEVLVPFLKDGKETREYIKL